MEIVLALAVGVMFAMAAGGVPALWLGEVGVYALGRAIWQRAGGGSAIHPVWR